MSIIPRAADDYSRKENLNFLQIRFRHETNTGEEGAAIDRNIETLNPAIKQTHEVSVDELNKFKEWELDSLIEYLVDDYHQNVKQNSITIYGLAERISCKHGAKHPELRKLTTILFLLFDDLFFLLKTEEKILFPNILQLIKKQSAGDLTTDSSLS
jgi:iron-sulfur cluster repair protein YtfE (RIC family)